jgi:hypothetical protein
MTEIKPVLKAHPQDEKLARFLSGSLSTPDRDALERHLAHCDECLAKAAMAYESVKEFRRKLPPGKDGIMKRINLYLVLAVAAFALSFIMPQYFLQLLVATLLLGIKWVVDSRTTKMLVMIYEAWKAGGGKEAGRVMDTLTQRRL